jgi:hypothetical protein
MAHLLLILLLVAPNDHDLGVRLCADLSTLVGAGGKVLVGAEATKQLETYGVRDGDLISSPEVGDQLTGRTPDLVLVRLETRKSGGDQVIESSVWLHGHVERHVAIAGQGYDAIDGAVHGVVAILAPLLVPDAGAAQDQEARLPQLAHAEDWKGVLALVDPYGPPPAHQSARALYYGVLAHVRLGQLDRARVVLGRMHAQWHDHVLTGAADSLLPGALLQSGR